jgi:site-specific DNA recombinase
MPAAARTIDPLKVAIYIRWSTEDQGEGTTLDVQMDGCSLFVKSQGWTVNPDLIFVDDGWSGGSLDRPALGRLRRLVSAGGVDCVVVFKLDRLSRNVVDTVNLVLREWENRCYLKSARENIDTFDPAGKMFFYTLVSFAEWERNTIRDRTFSGRVRRAQEGRNPGRKLPYGYGVGERRGEIVVVPGQAEVVRRVYREFLAGHSIRSIAFRLNQEAVPSPASGGWSAPTLSRMLSNEMYVGTLSFGVVTRMPADREPGTPRVVKNEKPLVIQEGAVPAIVSAADFALVQSLKRQNHAPAGRVPGARALSSAYLLSGVLECGLCGSNMRARPPYDRSVALYHCNTRFHQGPSSCDSSYVRQPVLDEIVVAELKARYGLPEQRAQYVGRYLDRLNGELQATEESLRGVAEKLAGLAQEEAHVRKHFRQQALTLEEYRQMSEDLKAEGEELRGREQVLSTRLEDLRATIGGQAMLLDAARKVDHWDELDPVEQKNVLRFFVETVRAFKRPKSNEIHCEITWKSASSGEAREGAP